MATVVLAHGAWSAAWAWKKVRPLMAAAGHTFFTPTYTGMGERAHLDSPDITLDTHIDDVLGVINTEELSNVVLLGHSYGGMVATGVADRARDRIKHLIYLDAFVPQNGESLSDHVPEALRQRMKDGAKATGGFVPPNPTPPDTSKEDMDWVSRHRKPQSLKCFEQKLRLTGGELTLPRSYIFCLKHADMGPFRKFIEPAKTQKGWRYYEIDSSHSPNVTAPKELVTLLDRVIAAV